MSVKRIVIEGIGGIGGPVAAGLIKEGYAVTLITGNQEITDAINENGVIMRSGDEEVSFYAKAHTEITDLPDPNKFDMAFLIMKATDVMEAARKTVPYLNSDGYLVTFQNGIIEDTLIDQSIVDKGQIVPAIVGFGGTMHEPGVYEKTSPGDIHIGEMDGTKSIRVENLKTILSAVENVVVTDNMRGVMWSKLAINCTITTFGGITGQKFGKMLKNKQTRLLFLRTYSEVIEVAEAYDITPEKIASRPYLLYMSKDASWFKRVFKDIIIRIVGWKYRDLKSSTLQSLERGRKSEVEFLNGYVVEQADQVDVNVPVNRQLTEMIKEIEEGKREIKPDNINQIELE